MKRYKVRCTFDIEVEVPDDVENPEFLLEENSCPGTGIVGAELQRIQEAHDIAGTCWACALQGSNKIIAELDV